MTAKYWISISLLAAICLGASGPDAQAHPVSYQGAVAVMTWNQTFLSDYWLAYSFRPDMAVAARAMRMTMSATNAGGGDLALFMPQLDYLVKRWNEPNHQANIYVYGGFGGVTYQGQTGTGGLAGIETDIESRKYFAMAKYEVMRSSLGTNFQGITGRLGIAPYEAEYDEVASWFMIQAQYHPDLSRSYAITPLIRFFYKSVLWETGVSTQGDWMLNFMFHF